MKRGKTRNKIWLTVLVEIIGIVLLGWFLFLMQSELSLQTQHTNSEAKLSAIETLLQEAKEDENETISVYDQMYASKADTAALLAQTKKDYEYTEENAKALRDVLDVYNVVFLDKEGNTLAEAVKTGTDYTAARYNELRTVFENGASSEPFNVTKDDQRLRYYGAQIDKDTMVVVEKKPDTMYAEIEKTTSLASTLRDVSVGLNGFAFAVSHLDYTFTYYPDDDLMGQDALSAGISIDDLQGEYDGYLDVNGESFYAVGKQIDDNYIFCVVPASEITGTANRTVIVVLLVFAVIVTMIIAYAYLLREEVRKDEEKRLAEEKEKEKKSTAAPKEDAAAEPQKRGRLHFDKKIGVKIIPIGVIGLLGILLLSFYMQTLFGLSQQSVSNTRHVQDAQETLEANTARTAELTEQCEDEYLAKCQAAAYVISQLEEDQLTQDFMIALRDALQSYDIWYFDMNGDTVASDNDYWDYSLSTDPESQSYEFRYILMGTTQQVIKEPQYNQTLEKVMCYIGVAVQDGEHHTTGMVQIGVTSEQLTKLLVNTDVASVLGDLQIGRNGFAFAVSKATEDGADPTFAYYPNDRMIGRNVYDYGMEDYQLKDGYSDIITLDGTKYYCASVETDDYYVYVAVPYSAAVSFRLPVGLATTVASLICLAVIILLLTLTTETVELPADSEEKTEKNSDMIDVVLGDGRVTKTQSALSRWSYRTINWNNKTAGQKMSFVAKIALGLISLLLVAIVVFPNRFFEETSVFHYILKGNWQKSLNIFAVTSCVLTSIVAYVCGAAARRLLMWFATALNAKGETICRLLDNFIKFAMIIGIIYYCLSTVGVDASTLVASAGILSLIVGLGAQSLVKDIIAGLFIVFEGEFQVGDIVTIGGYTGTVLEIGIRTTKVKNGGNIKVFSNSDVTGVLNMTKDYSSVSIEVGIEYGESLEYVEKVLSEELPLIKNRISTIVDGPYYKGVSELADSSVVIVMTASCREGDKGQLTYDLNREIKLIFDKHNINMPYPQIVVNQPAESHQASYWDKKKAQEFVEEQKELVQEMDTKEDQNEELEKRF